ncbi:hypothetical protein [Pasteuria penetrans]|uniref:hypothetical protein n=1 Tax=Pasteuria penetrans TaxID=86005 RepID=UPI000FA061AF|nr:hypothetical protein [Pasteuria penetrans]
MDSVKLDKGEGKAEKKDEAVVKQGITLHPSRATDESKEVAAVEYESEKDGYSERRECAALQGGNRIGEESLGRRSKRWPWSVCESCEILSDVGSAAVPAVVCGIITKNGWVATQCGIAGSVIVGTFKRNVWNPCEDLCSRR